MDAPAGADLRVVCIVATSESELAKYLSEIEPEIAVPDWEEEALLTVNEIAFGAALATGIIQGKINAIVPIKPKIRRTFLIILLPNAKLPCLKIHQN